MKRFLLLLAGILIVLIFALEYNDLEAQKTERSEQASKSLREIATSPPGSLDALFPPVAEEPIYLFRMIGLATPFEGIIVDLLENDLENARVNFEKFNTQYEEVSKLVSQWEKYFPKSPVEELGTALETGDQGKVMTAYEKVRKICHNCHIANMVGVQQRYHWGDFQAIQVTDTLTNEEVDFPRLMQSLSQNLSGISVNLEQGQKENALKEFQSFNAGFQLLKKTCSHCHEAKSKYYVDDAMQGLIDWFEQALRGSSYNPKVARSLSRRIQLESCFSCHMVHIPAAYSKHR